MKKRILSLLLAAALAFGAAPLAAFAEEPASEAVIGGADGPTAILVGTDEVSLIAETPAEDAAEGPEETDQLTYVALGDSIAAGSCLDDFLFTPAEIFYDFSPNFTGYSADCYTARVADMLGLDRQHAINLGLPALMTKDLLEMVRDGQMSAFNQPAGTYYVYPEFLDYIREADVISIEIGMNDAMVPFVVSIGEATNWKSEQLANTIITGGYRELNFKTLSEITKQVLGLRLTFQEMSDLLYAVTTGMANVCRQAYDNVETYLPQIVEVIHQANPDAQILLVGCYNPVPLLWPWSNFFNRYNRFVRELAEDTGCTYVAIPRTQTANDGHPTAAGHKYIAQQIVDAIDR